MSIFFQKDKYFFNVLYQTQHRFYCMQRHQKQKQIRVMSIRNARLMIEISIFQSLLQRINLNNAESNRLVQSFAFGVYNSIFFCSNRRNNIFKLNFPFGMPFKILSKVASRNEGRNFLIFPMKHIWGMWLSSLNHTPSLKTADCPACPKIKPFLILE